MGAVHNLETEPELVLPPSTKHEALRRWMEDRFLSRELHDLLRGIVLGYHAEDLAEFLGISIIEIDRRKRRFMVEGGQSVYQAASDILQSAFVQGRRRSEISPPRL